MPDLTPQAQQLEDQEMVVRILNILKHYFERRGLVLVVAALTSDVMMVKVGVAAVIGGGPPPPSALQDMIASAVVDYLKQFSNLGVQSFVKVGSVLS